VSGPSSAAPAKVPERLSEAGWTNDLLTGVRGRRILRVDLPLYGVLGSSHQTWSSGIMLVVEGVVLPAIARGA
jgi:hypothetical protein